MKRCLFMESRVLFRGRDLGPLSDNWAHERSHFRYYLGEISVEQ